MTIIARWSITDCLGEYLVFPGEQIQGGTPRAEATTVDECKLLCTQDPVCFGFDFAPGAPLAGCWLLTIDLGRVGATGVTHYELVTRDCPTSPPPGQSPPTLKRSHLPGPGAEHAILYIDSEMFLLF